MKRWTGLMLLGLCSWPALAAPPQMTQFRGVIQQDAAAPLHVDLQVPTARRAVLELADGGTLELAAPGQAGQQTATLRLVGATGDVAHGAQITDVAQGGVSFAYLLCAGQVTYINPLPATLPVCDPA